jgi:hypothetical protein
MYPDPRFSNPQEHRDTLRGSYHEPTSTEHGGCLTLWLVVQGLGTVYAAILLMGVFSQVSRARSPALTIYVAIVTVFIIGTIASLIGIWRWKRWGIYGIVAVSIFSPITEFIFATSSFSLLDCAQPFVGNLILYYLVHDKWDHYT